MNTTVCLIASIIACIVGSITKKYFSEGFENRELVRHVFNAVISIVAAVVLFLWGGIQSLSVFTVVLGIVFGIITALQLISNLKAMELGPWSYTSVITSLAMLIPTLSGAIFWNEHIKPNQIIGIIFMVVCFVLSVDKNSDVKKANLKWLLYCLVAFATSGLIGVMQKIHQTSSHKDELNGFLVMAFAVSFVYSAVNVAMIYLKRGKREKNQAQVEGENKKKLYTLLSFAIMIICGVCTAMNHKLNLYLSGAMDSAVFFPVFNGSVLVLTVVMAVVLFRERLSLKKWIGVIFGSIAVMLLVL